MNTQNQFLSFTEKVVLVTGASSGIGAATAIAFSKLGANLAITGRNLENLQKTATNCPGQQPLIIQADLSKENDVEKIIKETINHFGKLDVLINNAGIFELGTIMNANLGQFDRIFNTNLRSVFQLTALAVPHLIKTKGNIVNVSSLAGLVSFDIMLVYGMSKAALNHFTKSVAVELAPKGVRVNCVVPGLIKTDILNRLGFPKEIVSEMEQKGAEVCPTGRSGESEEVADLITYLASDRSGFITGVNVPIDGGSCNVAAK